MHSTLRILFAFALAAWSLLCCCQTSVFLGAACSDQAPQLAAAMEQPIAADSCCRRCAKGQAGEKPAAPQPAPSPDDVPDSKSCASCAQCLGLAETSRPTAAPRPILTTVPPLHTLQLLLSSDWSRVLCASPHRAFEAETLHTASSFMRSNRDAQRWHCALLM